MTASWNPEKEQHLARLLIEREGKQRSSEAWSDLNGRLTLEPAANNWSTLGLHLDLGSRIKLELVEQYYSANCAVSELAGKFEEIADTVDDLATRRLEWVENVRALRHHLSKRIAAERRRGARIGGTINFAQTKLEDVPHMKPTLTLEMPFEDLRIHEDDFIVGSEEDIDMVLDGVRHDVIMHSKELHRLEAQGAVGRVHPMLIKGLSSRGLVIEDTIRTIHHDLQKYQDHGPTDNFVTAYWSKGVLTGSFDLGGDLFFREDHIVQAISEEHSASKKLHPGEIAARLGLYANDRMQAVSVNRTLGSEMLKVEAEPIPYRVDGTLVE